MLHNLKILYTVTKQLISTDEVVQICFYTKENFTGYVQKIWPEHAKPWASSFVIYKTVFHDQ